MGFPIRTSPDHRLFAAPRRFSQRTTSFIASWRQGIHRKPLLACSRIPLTSTRSGCPKRREGRVRPPARCVISTLLPDGILNLLSLMFFFQPDPCHHEPDWLLLVVFFATHALSTVGTHKGARRKGVTCDDSRVFTCQRLQRQPAPAGRQVRVGPLKAEERRQMPVSGPLRGGTPAVEQDRHRHPANRVGWMWSGSTVSIGTDVKRRSMMMDSLDRR